MHAKGQQTDLRRVAIFTSFSDEARLDAVEQIIPAAEKAGLRMTQLAMVFATAHPAVTSAIIGPRTMEQLDDLLGRGRDAGGGRLGSTQPQWGQRSGVLASTSPDISAIPRGVESRSPSWRGLKDLFRRLPRTRLPVERLLILG